VVIDLSLHNIYGRPASFITIATLTGGMVNTLDALDEFKSIISHSVIKSSLLFMPLFYKASTRKYRFSFAYVAIPTSALCILYLATLTIKGDVSVVGFPKGFAYSIGQISYLTNNLYNKLIDADTIINPEESSKYKKTKVILIVDESIRHKEFSELLADNDERMINFGRTMSGANCSAASNYIIRKAGWLRSGDSSIKLLEFESLFSLAKKAGYATIYIDNQNALSDPFEKNYFDKEELGKIDRIIDGQGEFYERDAKSLDTIKALLNQNNIFIILNKIGAHFPYESTIAPSQREGDKISNYLASIKVNSVAWIIELAKDIDSDSIIFYTSDHGQDLNGRSAHCNIGDQARQDEYLVPFLIASGDAVMKKTIKNNLNLYIDRLSHIEISESVRNALGFNFETVDSIFKSPSYLDRAYCGVYGPAKTIFGINPKCIRIN
jgi:glucan phosphoethanolaminetransferase (alkaline phosphatase superfamily)